MKTIALVLVVLPLTMVVWGLFFENSAITIVINGEQITGPLKGAIGAGGLIVALVALFCAATLLVFVFTGTSMLLLGAVLSAGLLTAASASPLLVILLIPVVVVWAFVAPARRRS